MNVDNPTFADAVESSVRPDASAEKKELEPGQVRYVYFWVHPQWRPQFSIDVEMKSYKKFIDRLHAAPRVALVQIADSPRSDLIQHQAYRDFIEMLKEIDVYAVQSLGDRYGVWDKARFFDARNTSHVQWLVEKLSLIESSQKELLTGWEQDFGQESKYLAKISVFGKERDTCPIRQAAQMGLHSIASVIRYYSQETPEDIMPPTPKNPFPNQGYSEFVGDR